MSGINAQTIGEVNIIFQNVLDRLDDIANEVKDNTKLTQLVLEQATKTNGRMNVVEPLAFDYREKRARFTGGVWVIALTGGLVMSGAMFMGKLYIDKTEQKISDGVIQKIESKYNIQYGQ